MQAQIQNHGGRGERKNKLKLEQIAQIAQMTVEQIVAIGKKAAVL